MQFAGFVVNIELKAEIADGEHLFGEGRLGLGSRFQPNLFEIPKN